jgi:hypothetical protein
MSKPLDHVAASAIILCLSAGVARPSDPDGLETLWADLAANDPEKAQRAIDQVVARPEEAVPFLAQRLKPADSLSPRRLARLLADLDSDEFEVRTRASCELEKVAEVVEADLRQALSGRPSPEVRRRVEALLEGIARRRLLPTPERRREERGIEMLEQVGNGPARELLGRLARGAAAAPLTRDAKGALGRLADTPAVLQRMGRRQGP